MDQGKVTSLRSLLILIAVAFIFPLKAFSLGMPATEYWFAVPHVLKAVDDNYFGESPFYLSIHSDYGAVVSIEAADTSLLDKRVTVKKGETLRVYLPESLMNKDNEKEKPKGIHVLSDRPISVTFFISYTWTGEAFRLLPVELLGKKYMSLNLYEDKTDTYNSPEILIVATEDNTKITYTPTVKTSHADPGEPYSFFLQKGQSYLLEIYESPGLVQDWASDLSGTYIESSRPIAVISGHPKGAFPRENATVYSTGANYMRNNMSEMLLPFDYIGTEYVSAPLLYKKRLTGIIQDDRGDLVRFVALNDSTTVSKKKSDGSGYQAIGIIIKKGGRLDIINQDKAENYKSDKPVIVGQYGKTWQAQLLPPMADKKGDYPQNPTGTGQGMLLSLLPVNMWQSYANFESLQGLDNFIYMTFKTSDASNIFFDGQPVNSVFYAGMNAIKGSDFSYILFGIDPGYHKLTTTNNARFAAYPYGNHDGTSEGYAYGYTAAYDYFSDCNDTLVVTDTVKDCGGFSSFMQTVNLDGDTCGAIMDISIDADSSYNYDMSSNLSKPSKQLNFKLNVIDLTKPARVFVRALANSGRIFNHVYEYFPETITTNNSKLDFGDFALGDTVCKTVTVTNSGQTDLTLYQLSLTDTNFYISNVNLPMTLAPGASGDIVVCALPETLPNKLPVTSLLITNMTCLKDTLSSLSFKTGERIVRVSDAHWDNIPVGIESSKPVAIVNKSNYSVTIYSIDWSDKVHFQKVENLTLPLTIEPMSNYSFTAFYIPDATDATDSVRAIFTSNATKEKLYSDWVGKSVTTGINDADESRFFSLDQNIPNPVSATAFINYYIGKYSNVNISLYNCLGAKVCDLVNAPHPVGNYHLSLDISNLGLADGVYYYCLESGTVRLTRSLTVIR